MSLGKRKEAVDDVASYSSKLSQDEKAWMNQFMKEYNDADTKNAIFHNDEILTDHNGEVIMTTNRWGVITEKSVPMTARKLCNDRNNSRNRCWYTEEVAANRLNLVESDQEMERILHGEDLDAHEGGEIDEEPMEDLDID